MPATNDPLGPERERLAADVAAQAALVLRNVRLIEELRDSRRRIVAAQDAASDGASSATCTTGRSSSWWRWR